MSYEPTQWKTGDIVTSAKLNRLENAVANVGILVINSQNNTLDKTYQEIEDAFANGVTCAVFSHSEEMQECNFVTMIGVNEGAYAVGIFNPRTQRMIVFQTDTKDGYPVAAK